MLKKEFPEESILRHEKNGKYAQLIACGTLGHMYKMEILTHPASTTVFSRYQPANLSARADAFTDWIILYYNIAFGALAVICSLNRLRHHGRYLKNAVPLIIFTIILVDVATMSPTVLAVTPPHSPTYQEAMQFITSDKTNVNMYLEDRYTCTNFATDFSDNALGKGYVCGYVIVYFPNGQCHAIDCFNTTDCGLIFVEPQTDSIIQLIRNQPYWDRTKHGPQSYNDTVLNYAISWQTGSNAPSYSRLILILASIGFCTGLMQSFSYPVTRSIAKSISSVRYQVPTESC